MSEGRGTFRALAGGSSWAVIGQMMFNATQMVVFWVLSLTLAPQDLGLYQYVASTLALFSMFSVGAFGGLANKFVAELKDQDPTRAGRILALSWGASLFFTFVVAVCAVVLADRVAIGLCKTPEVERYLVVGAAALFGMALLGVGRGVLAGLRAFNITALSYGWLTLTTLPLVGGGAYIWGLDGAVVGMVANYIIGGSICAWLAARSTRRYGLRVLWHRFATEWRLLDTFWLPSMLAVLISAPGVMLVQAIMLRQPWGAMELGFFSPSFVMHHFVGMVPAAISPVVLTLLSEVSSDGQHDQFRSVYSMQLRAVWMVTLAIAIVVTCGSKAALLVFKPIYAWTWPYLATLSFVGLLKAVNGTAEQVLASKRRQWLRFLNSCSWVAVMLVAAWFLIPTYGPGGAALAYLLGHGANSVLNFMSVRWGIGLRMDMVTRRLLWVTAGAMLPSVVVAVHLPWQLGLITAVTLASGVVWVMWKVCLHDLERDRLLAFAWRRVPWKAKSTCCDESELSG